MYPTSWVDFTRRNDPACEEAVKIFDRRFTSEPAPKVFMFWTKAPAVVDALYKGRIKAMQKAGTLVLAHVTLNNYLEMESISMAHRRLSGLVDTLGADHIRLRFDPIIAGYTKPDHFIMALCAAEDFGIKRIITNFLVPSYKGVGKLLKDRGFHVYDLYRSQKIGLLKHMVVQAADRNIELAVCAEMAGLILDVPGLMKASCADPDWAFSLRPDLAGAFKFHPCRQGCGCYYSQDWGVYHNQGGYACPHQCLYCYAK